MTPPRRVLASVVGLGLAALAAGPVWAVVGGDRDVTPADLALSPDPYAAPVAAPWPTGVTDTRTAGRLDRGPLVPAPAGEYLSPAQALTRLPRTAYVAVTGPTTGRRLPGVGAVVDRDAVETLLDLDEPLRTEVVRHLTATDGAALGLVAADRPPGADVRVVDHDSNEHRRRLLQATDPQVGELVDLWAQQRPDLTVLVDPDPGEAGAPAAVDDVGMATATSRRPARPPARPSPTAVAHQVMNELSLRRALVAPLLLDDGSGDGLLALDPLGEGPAPTTRGAAYAVAALAVPPGSREAPTVATQGLTALAFERPQGGASVLVWNPGPSRRLTVDLPYGEQVHRVRLRIAGAALSAVLLER